MKKLHISQDDKMLLGICGGIAESFGMNANLVRLIFVASFFAGTAGFWIYVVLAIILPKKDDETQIIDIEPESEPEGKKIYRMWENRMLGGVCAGIAKHFGWDVTLIRLIFVGLAMTGGIGVLLYVALWFLFPNEE